MLTNQILTNIVKCNKILTNKQKQMLTNIYKYLLNKKNLKTFLKNIFTKQLLIKVIKEKVLKLKYCT